MASINKLKRDYTGVGSIVLSKLLYLESGLLNNSSPSISVETTGDNTIFTVPSGVIGFDISSLKILLLGAATTGSLIGSIGTNSPNFDNILPSTTFTGLNSIGDMWRASLNGKVKRATPGEVVTFRITNAVSGSGAIVNVFAEGQIVTA